MREIAGLSPESPVCAESWYKAAFVILVQACVVPSSTALLQEYSVIIIHCKIMGKVGWTHPSLWELCNIHNCSGLWGIADCLSPEGAEAIIKAEDLEAWSSLLFLTYTVSDQVKIPFLTQQNKTCSATCNEGAPIWQSGSRLYLRFPEIYPFAILC